MVIALILAGCGSNNIAPDASVSCAGHDQTAFPTFDRTCAIAADCVVVFHQTDCCGDTLALGLNASQMAAFDVAENTCRYQYPECGCPAQPSVADDGTRGSVGPFRFDVSCVGLQCTSHAVDLNAADAGI